MSKQSSLEMLESVYSSELYNFKYIYFIWIDTDKVQLRQNLNSSNLSDIAASGHLLVISMCGVYTWMVICT